MNCPPCRTGHSRREQVAIPSATVVWRRVGPSGLHSVSDEHACDEVPLWPSEDSTRAVAPPISAVGAMIRPYRVVVAKPGLDGHDRGAKVIARALRDSGFEVIYTGLHQTPDQVVAAAVQEDADAVGLSMLSGAHLTLVPKVVDGLRAAGLADVLLVVGGIIPDADIPALKDAGVAEVFTPGAPLPSIAEWLATALDERERSQAGA